MFYIQALIIGLLGSFHCAGMCGPIALALPLKGSSWQTKAFSGILYNFGRILTYSLLGLILGLLGFGLSLWGMQRWVLIVVGIIMILSVFFPIFFSSLQSGSFINKPLKQLRVLFAKFLGLNSNFAIFTIGLLNGLLPCGLVNMALAGAVVSNNPTEGAIYMLFFGLGTIPVLLSVSLLGNIISVRFRNSIRRIIPFFIVFIGILFILRGLNLGIPYISPKMIPHEAAKCCH